MSTASTYPAAAPRQAASSIDGLVRSIAIPPRPSLVVELQAEIASDDPDFRRIARIVAVDVGLTAAVLRSVNSPFYALSRRAETLDQAVSLIGLRQIGALITGLVLRRVLRADGPDLGPYWSMFERRCYAMTQLAAGIRGVPADVAHSFGLFCDVGILLLLPRFAGYAQTIERAAQSTDHTFTEVEQAAHKTDHALVGALVARTWGLSTAVCQAIRLHHDPVALADPETPEVVALMVAMGVLSELAIQRHAGHADSAEWTRSGAAASATLRLSTVEVEAWMARLAGDIPAD